MAYIWENYSENTEFHVGERVSPYLEVAFPDSAGGTVNPLLRFARLFAPLAELRERGGEPSAREAENLLFHFLANLDLLSGLDERQIRMNALEREILAGSFGRFCADRWPELTAHDQRIILHTLAERCGSESAGRWFFQAARRLWEYVSILWEPAGERCYVFLSACKTEYSVMALEILVQLFWDFQCGFQAVWQRHYGVIGADRSMRISEIQIV